jgi:hypothetical protein
MECAVYDTYVTKKDGKTMHFDVIVEAKIQKYREDLQVHQRASLSQ